MHLWEPMCLFPQRRVFFTRWLVLPTMIQLGHLSATQLKQVIMLSMCESPLPTADTQRYLFWLRAEGLWNMSFHLLPAAVNGACVNTQGSSRLCFEIFLCVGIPQHYGLQRNVSHGTLLLPLGSREHHLSTSKKSFHLTVCQNVFFLVLLINRNSLRAASYCAFKTMTDLNSLKPCILFFMFEAVAKTCRKC